ncbi:MAG: esterase [Alcanivorax borkumensis]|jgi:acyl-CoA thioesterase-1|nr:MULTISPECIES: arylesterase [Alcanivorax]EUC70541.1 esterase [Alcanivorax sp. 97CO-5]OJH08925.1 MAG: esterase [Alcanivorax borkumensis]PKG02200.1 arylesterase [Alcanivorax sp. 97CO-6]BAP14298.1 acyl-CoA thioesterase [Alcanivorax sp. NBRC 101098]
MARYLLLVQLLCLAASVHANGVLILGDSISAAYGIEKSSGWVALMDRQLKERCPDFPVINASVSGETTAGGKARLPTLLARHKPDLVVVELGGNDGLRGLSPMVMASNLKQMISLSRQAEADVVLLGMRIPPNYGQQYTALFERQYRDVAQSTSVPWVPFFLEGVIEQGWMQGDGIHPTIEAQPLLLETALSVIEPQLPSRCRSHISTETE